MGSGLLVALLGGIPTAYEAALIAGGAAIMVSVGVAACIAPARRALRIEPIEALEADG